MASLWQIRIVNIINLETGFHCSLLGGLQAIWKAMWSDTPTILEIKSYILFCYVPCLVWTLVIMAFHDVLFLLPLLRVIFSSPLLVPVFVHRFKQSDYVDYVIISSFHHVVIMPCESQIFETLFPCYVSRNFSYFFRILQ